MKKITLLLLSLIVFQFANAQLSEDFEGSITIPIGWAVFDNSVGTVESWQISDGATNNVAYVNWEAVTGTAEDWLVTPQFTVDATNFILSFDQSDSYATDYGSVYTIRISTASQTTPGDFTIVDTQTEVDVWSGGPLAQHTVDLTAYIGQPIYVAFVMENNDGDRWIIDNVEMIADATAPDPVINPTPADNAVDVYIDPTNGDNAVAFAWEAAATGDPATAYDVYLGDSPTTLNLLGTLGANSVNITGMIYDTEYFWQIVAKNVGGEAIGSEVWSFTTQADPTASVDDFNSNTFSYSYNKNTDILTIESSNLPFDGIELYNILGQNVLTKTLNNTSEVINMSNLKDGVYLAKVSIEGQIQTVKLIKH